MNKVADAFANLRNMSAQEGSSFVCIKFQDSVDTNRLSSSEDKDSEDTSTVKCNGR